MILKIKGSLHGLNQLRTSPEVPNPTHRNCVRPIPKREHYSFFGGIDFLKLDAISELRCCCTFDRREETDEMTLAGDLPRATSKCNAQDAML